MANETREALLNELAEYASPGLLARFERHGTDTQLRDALAGAKAQKAAYEMIEAARAP
jgi:hypothetical protein